MQPSNWRTTAGGIVAAFFGCGPAIIHFLQGGFVAVTTPDMLAVGAFLSVLFALFHAKDKQN